MENDLHMEQKRQPPYSSLTTHQDLDGEVKGFDFKMSDRQALKKVVKTMFPGLNHQQRRAKVSEFHKILHQKDKK